MNDTTPTGSIGESGNLVLDISNAFVAIHKDLYGRGPTTARTHISGDLIVVLLEGGFSQVEQTLTDHGREEAVNEGRAAMQESIENPGVMAIERLTGRKVRSFMSANDAANELQAELFVLEATAEQPAPDLAARAEAARAQNIAVREDLRALTAEQEQAREALHKRRERKD
jgi:uncharacterized protein YbcI